MLTDSGTRKQMGRFAPDGSISMAAGTGLTIPAADRLDG